MFYVVALSRVEELVRKCKNRNDLPEAAELLNRFKQRWPGLRELRNHEEHLLGPTMNPAGYWYLPDVVLEVGGRNRYIIDVRQHREVTQFIQDLRDAIDAELAKA